MAEILKYQVQSSLSNNNFTSKHYVHSLKKSTVCETYILINHIEPSID